MGGNRRQQLNINYLLRIVILSPMWLGLPGNQQIRHIDTSSSKQYNRTVSNGKPV